MSEPAGRSDGIPARHFESLAERELSYFWHRSRVNWVETVLRRSYPDPGRLNVVDFGCGTGGLLHLVGKRIGLQRSLGVDASAQAIAGLRLVTPRTT